MIKSILAAGAAMILIGGCASHESMTARKSVRCGDGTATFEAGTKSDWTGSRRTVQVVFSGGGDNSVAKSHLESSVRAEDIELRADAESARAWLWDTKSGRSVLSVDFNQGRMWDHCAQQPAWARK